MANEDESVWAAQNGELYNFVDLRPELEGKGHRFRTRCDTEVLVHLYEEHGDRLMDRLNGMFALAVWDTKERKLLLARDRAGIKPLFYYHDDERFVFGSEIKAILEHPAVPRELVASKNRLLERKLLELRRGRIAAERDAAEAARKELKIKIERERAKAAERAARQRKELELDVEKRENALVGTNAGFRAGMTLVKWAYFGDLLEWADGVWRPEVHASWRQVWNDHDRALSSRLDGAPSGAPRFRTETEDAEIGADFGASVIFQPYGTRNTIELGYEGFVGDGSMSHAAMLRFRMPL